MSANYAADHGDDHQRLWRERLLEWANGKNGQVHLPDDRNGSGRHVQLPRSQAALRLSEIKALPRFFQRCGFRPGKSADANEVEARLRSLRHDPAVFPHAFTRIVLKDELRFPVACRQVIQALNAWDGRWQIPVASRRSEKHISREDCWLAISLSRGRLISKCGTDLATSRLVSTDELCRLFEGETIDGEMKLTVHDDLSMFRYNTDDLAFKNSDCVEPGDRCLLAATPRALITAQRLLQDATIVQKDRSFHSVDDGVDTYDGIALEGIPAGCQLLEITIENTLPHPEFVSEGWSKFLRTPAPRLVPSGGLRISKKRVWMVGAGPYIRVVGNRLPGSIIVDGVTSSLAGRTFPHDLFSDYGDHHVSAVIDGQETTCHFRIRDSLASAASTDPVGAWVFRDHKWPQFETIIPSEDGEEVGVRISGVQIWGDDADPSAKDTDDKDRLEAIRLLAYRARVSNGGGHNEPAEHPITRQLQRRAVVQALRSRKAGAE